MLVACLVVPSPSVSTIIDGTGAVVVVVVVKGIDFRQSIARHDLCNHRFAPSGYSANSPIPVPESSPQPQWS